MAIGPCFYTCWMALVTMVFSQVPSVVMSSLGTDPLGPPSHLHPGITKSNSTISSPHVHLSTHTDTTSKTVITTRPLNYHIYTKTPNIIIVRHLSSKSTAISTMVTTTNANSARQDFLRRAAEEPAHKVGVQIQRFGAPVVVIFGIIGNILSFLVMIKKHNRHKSTCIYLAALAITDIGSLLTYSYLWFVTEFKLPWSDAGCKLWVYVVFLMTAGSAFTLLVVTVDRWIAICFPLKSLVWCTPSRTRTVLIVTYVAVSLFYIPMALQAAVGEGSVCASFATGTKISKILSWVNLIVLPIIPFFLILPMNIMVIINVYKSKKFTETYTNQDNRRMNAFPNGIYRGSRNVPSREHQLTVMLLSVSFAYLIIILPISVRVLAYNFINIYASTKTYAIYVLLYTGLNLLLYLNNAINFYLYCISGSSFRSDLKRLSYCRMKSSSSNMNVAAISARGISTDNGT